MIDKVDEMIIGGGMAFTFLHHQGVNIGKSLLDTEGLEVVPRILEKAAHHNVNIHLPVDFVIAQEIKDDAVTRIVTRVEGVPEGFMGLDIGPQSIEQFINVIERANTVLWNGPMGVFERRPFTEGSKAVLATLIGTTERGASVVIGGGDTATCAINFGGEGKVTHISTGGGASLELLEGKQLPGVVALSDK